MPEWRSVIGYEDRYEVSDSGQVRNVKTGRILKPGIFGTHGHYGVILCRSGTRKAMYVHVLMLEAFRCPRPPGLIARHLDDVPERNLIENLAWGTPRENTLDALRGERRARGLRRRHKPRQTRPGGKQA